MLAEQTSLFEEEYQLLPYEDYDVIYCCISGGKDSVGMLLKLLDDGAPRDKIRLVHHEVDGRGERFIDWPSSRHYCELIAQKFCLPIEFSWLEDGFKGELLKLNDVSKPICFEYQGEVIKIPTSHRAKPNTRRRWPAMSADLNTRWCSAKLKIEVFDKFIGYHPDFQRFGTKILVCTGERWEESVNRSRYKKVEPHRKNTIKRRVDHFRPVIAFEEKDIWDLFEKHNLCPHPAYFLGYSRTSCMACIYLDSSMWRFVEHIDPEFFYNLVQMENRLNFTIDKNMSLTEKASLGTLDRFPIDHKDFEKWKRWALSEDAMTLEDLNGYIRPAGAYRGNCGGS